MPLTPAKLDDRSFEEIFLEVRRRIPIYMPEWTDHNESDPGVAMLQLFSWLTETIAYRMDRIPDERMYREFLNLIGIAPGVAQPARCAVAFDVALGSPAATLTPSELLLAVAVDGEDVFFEPEAKVPVVGVALSALLTDDRARPVFQDRLEAQQSREPFEAFGVTNAREAALYLGLDTSPEGVGNPLDAAGKQLQILIGVEPGEGVTEPQSTFFKIPSETTRSGVVWQGWNGQAWEALEAADQTSGFRRSGSVRVTLTANLAPRSLTADPDPRQRFWLRAVAKTARKPGTLIRYVEVNATRVAQWRTFADESLRPGSDGTTDQQRSVRNGPILIQGIDSPLVRVKNDEGAWQRIDVFPRPRRGVEPERHFVLQDDSTLLFGDGENARIPAKGLDNLFVTYRSGGGTRGNGLDELALSRSPLRIEGVRTLERSAGGTEAQSLQSAEEEAPSRIKARERAVTGDDFVALAISKASVGRAIALNRVHPAHGTTRVTGAISLIVIPHRQDDTPTPMPSESFLRGVSAALEPYRVLTTELFVVAPRYRGVGFAGTLVVERGADIAKAQKAASDAIRAFIDPLAGGFEKTGWPIGRAVAYGDVISQLLAVPDVISVNQLRLGLDGTELVLCADAVIGPYELVRVASLDLEVQESGA